MKMLVPIFILSFPLLSIAQDTGSDDAELTPVSTDENSEEDSEPADELEDGTVPSDEEPADGSDEPVGETDSSATSDDLIRQESSGEFPASPDDIEIPYVERDPEEAIAARDEAAADLLAYAHSSKTVVIGRVLTSRIEPGFPDELVELSIEETLRGDTTGIITIRVPRFASDETDDGLTPSAVVEGYRLLAFLDPSGTIVGGNALFYVEAGYAFRNRSSDVFIRPRSDRDWISEIDPSEDYVVYSMADIQSTLDENPMRRRRRAVGRSCWFGRNR